MGQKLPNKNQTKDDFLFLDINDNLLLTKKYVFT